MRHAYLSSALAVSRAAQIIDVAMRNCQMTYGTHFLGQAHNIRQAAEGRRRVLDIFHGYKYRRRRNVPRVHRLVRKSVLVTTTNQNGKGQWQTNNYDGNRDTDFEGETHFGVAAIDMMFHHS